MVLVDARNRAVGLPVRFFEGTPRFAPAALNLSQPSEVRSRDYRTVRRWLLLILFSSIFLQRFALHLGGAGIPLNLFASLLALVVLSFRGHLNFDPVRAALVMAFAAYTVLSVIFNANTASWASAGLAIFTYIPFAFILRERDGLFMDCIRAFRSMVLICAGCGIGQFVVQTVITSPILFTFDGFLPKDILLEGFATYQPIAYGVNLMRSNGFFMLEPSMFSQYLALAVIVELLFFNSKWRLAVLGAGLMFSYSGTGLIALVLIPGILMSRRSYGTLVLIALLCCLAWATSELLHLDVMAQRATEFDSTETSAHARFVAPAELISRYLFSNVNGLLFGVGPGAMRDYQILMPYETHDPAWAKLLLEYGLVGSALFWSMFVLSVFVHSPSKWLGMALAIGFVSFGGELLDPRLQALMLVFCVLPKQAAFAYLRVLPWPQLIPNPV